MREKDAVMPVQRPFPSRRWMTNFPRPSWLSDETDDGAKC
jgi:hypothetical protein